jgi:hypothetical protein
MSQDDLLRTLFRRSAIAGQREDATLVVLHDQYGITAGDGLANRSLAGSLCAEPRGQEEHDDAPRDSHSHTHLSQ